MQQVAQAWLVLQLTHDPIWLGIVAAAQFIPVMIFGLFAGVLADALPKRRVLIWTQASMMILAGILAALVYANVVEVWMILALAILLGVANAVDMPVRQAFSVEMVGREDVAPAVALNSALFNAARVVGPAVAGLAIGAFGVALAFGLNAASFLAAIVGLALMDERTLRIGKRIERPDSVSAVVGNLREGLHYVRQTPVVLLAVVVVGAVATVGMNFGVIIPAYAQDVVKTDAAGYGFLMAASGIGSLLAALHARVRRAAATIAHRDRGDHPRDRVDRAGRNTDHADRARVDAPHRFWLDPHGRDREHGDPDGCARRAARPGDERLHDGLLGLGADRRASRWVPSLRASASLWRSPSAAS